MTFQELKAILQQEGISELSYDILGTGSVRGYDGFVIKEAAAIGYDIFYMERGKSTFLEHAESEHIACKCFLAWFFKTGDKHLAKYLELEDILEDGRLVEPSKGKYDLFGAIALSEKLGRPLTDEESKQFER